MCPRQIVNGSCGYSEYLALVPKKIRLAVFDRGCNIPRKIWVKFHTNRSWPVLLQELLGDPIVIPIYVNTQEVQLPRHLALPKYLKHISRGHHHINQVLLTVLVLSHEVPARVEQIPLPTLVGAQVVSVILLAPSAHLHEDLVVGLYQIEYCFNNSVLLCLRGVPPFSFAKILKSFG